MKYNIILNGALLALLMLGVIHTSAASQERTLSSTHPFWTVLSDSTLNRLMGEATEGNLDLRVATAGVDGASAVRREGALNFAPVVTAGAGFTRRRFSSSQFPSVGGTAFPDQNLWDVGVTTSWELDVFGRLRRTYNAQSAMRDAATENVRDVEVAVAAQVAQAYFDMRGTQGRLTVARRNAENQQSTLELTELRLEAGQGNAFDVERARAQLNLTLAAIPSLERAVTDAQYRVAVLVGRSPREMANELSTARDLPQFPSDVPVPNSMVVARNRPDVLRAERELAANIAMVGAARADFLPRVSLAGGVGYTAGALGSFGERGTLGYNFGPVISWPLFDIGRVKARVDVARAQQEAAQARYDNALLLAEEELEAAMVRYRSERQRLEYLTEAAAASERAAALARQRYQGGIANFFEVLDAERTLLAAQDQLALGRTEAARAYVQLFQATGN